MQREKGPVYIEGILELVNPSWLSSEGQVLLLEAIGDRVERSSKSVEHILQRPDFNINVKLVGILFGEPVGLDSMFSSMHYNSFVLNISFQLDCCNL